MNTTLSTFFHSTQVFLMEQKISSLEHENEFLNSFKISTQKFFTQQM